MKRIVFLSTLLCLSILELSAQKKVMQNEDKALWNRIRNMQISNSGDFMLYSLGPEEKDQTLHVRTTKGDNVMSYQRSGYGQFSFDSKYVLFKVNAFKDSIKAMKRKKVKKKDLPKDSLIIYNLGNKSIAKIPNVKSYRMPEKWSGVVAYMLEPAKAKKKDPKAKKKDSTKTKEKKPAKKKKTKKVSKVNGYHLVIRQLESGVEDTLKFVHKYSMAKKGKFITYATSGEKDKTKAGVYRYDAQSGNSTLLFESHAKTKYPQLGISESGKKIGFVVDADSTKSLIKKPNLYAWNQGDRAARIIVSSEKNTSSLLVSSDERLRFSENEERLFFGLRTTPIVKDTTLLPEEIVNVEVWTYDEPTLYTVQELQVKNNKKKAYLSLYDFNQNKMVQIANLEFDMARYGDEGNSDYAIIGNRTPYMLESQWTAQRPMDMQRVDLNTGQTSDIGTKIYGGSSISPKGKYLYGYSRKDSTWFAYNLQTLKYKALTKGRTQFYNELHDYPDDPYSYGSAGWTENDSKILLYDRFDIWSFDPETGASENLTNGRASQTRYRYLRLDQEERSISNSQKWMLSTFNEQTKDGGFASYNPKKKSIKELISGPYSYGRPRLAEDDKQARLL